MFKNLQWKVPTWPGLIGLIGLAVSVIAQVSHVSGLPNNARVALLSVSGFLVGVERVMQAVDNAVASSNGAISAVVTEKPVPAAPVVPPAAPVVPAPAGPAGPATPPPPTVA